MRTFASNYGRDFGWWVEREGDVVAALIDPRAEDMFWYSYAIEPLTKGVAVRAEVFTEAFWSRPGLSFRNRGTGEVAPGAFPGAYVGGAPRIIMRGLYSMLRPTLIERIALWFQMRRSQGRRCARRWHRRSGRGP